MLENIRNPHYMNASKTIIGFVIINPNGGSEQIGQYTIPGPEEGTNKDHEYIKVNFDMDQMAIDVDKAVEWEKKQLQIIKLKDEGNAEASILARLFNLKAEAFKLPWIHSASTETKMAVRRSPNENILNTILSVEMMRYMEKESLNYGDLLDQVEDIMYGE